MGASMGKPTESVLFPEFVTKLPNLEGKTIAITGCTSGTGLVLAKTSAKHGAKHVIMLNRSSERATLAEQAVNEVKASGTVVETIPCDLQDLESVKAAITKIKAKYEAIDVLCNNAGVMAVEDIATKDGYDVQMQTNHLAHFILTKELFPLLKRAQELRGDARIVNHSSIARSGGPLKAEYFEKRGGNLGGNSSSMVFGGGKWERYHQTKLANSVFTAALKERLEGTNIKAACAAPGFASTSLAGTSTGMGSMMWMMYFAQSAEDGTMPLLSACFDPTTVNGDFWEPANKGGMSGPAIKVPYDKNTADPEQAKLLWEKSEEACGKFECK